MFQPFRLRYFFEIFWSHFVRDIKEFNVSSSLGYETKGNQRQCYVHSNQKYMLLSYHFRYVTKVNLSDLYLLCSMQIVCLKDFV